METYIWLIRLAASLIWKTLGIDIGYGLKGWFPLAIAPVVKNKKKKGTSESVNMKYTEIIFLYL